MSNIKASTRKYMSASGYLQCQAIIVQSIQVCICTGRRGRRINNFTNGFIRFRHNMYSQTTHRALFGSTRSTSPSMSYLVHIFCPQQPSHKCSASARRKPCNTDYNDCCRNSPRSTDASSVSNYKQIPHNGNHGKQYLERERDGERERERERERETAKRR